MLSSRDETHPLMMRSSAPPASDEMRVRPPTTPPPPSSPPLLLLLLLLLSIGRRSLVPRPMTYRSHSETFILLRNNAVKQRCFTKYVSSWTGLESTAQTASFSRAPLTIPSVC